LSSKSTFSNATAKSYAMALYELCQESAELSKVEEEIKEFSKFLNESLELKEVMISPAVTKESKKQIVSQIANQNNFSVIFKNFLNFIAEKNRLFFLEKIIESFLNLISKSKGELKALLTSSKKLSIEEQKKIQMDLSKDFNSDLKINYKHDPELIAGLIVQVGSIMVDTSLKSKLKKLEKNMVEA
jgi:F-type H+-transporting ATPase subunit delta